MKPTQPLPVIDPFSLPMETTGRYRMLVAFAVVAAWGLSAHFVEVPNFILHLDEIPADIVLRLGPAAQKGFLNIEPDEFVELWRFGHEHPVFGALDRQVLRMLVSVALVGTLVGLAAAVQGLVRRRYRARYPSLEARGAGRAVREVRDLARRVAGIETLDLRHKPGLLGGLSFGERGREAVVLAGTPDQLEQGWNDLHRAVALHELGHWANGDVRRQERARGLLVALGALSAFALAAARVVNRAAAAAQLGDALSLAGALGIAWSLWAGLVRAREFEADWRVVAWGGGPALEQCLALESASVLAGPPAARGRIRGRLGDLAGRLDRLLPWRFHPPHGARLDALRHPERLFRLHPDVAIFAGLSLALIVGRLGPLAMDALVPFAVVTAPLALFPIFMLALVVLFLVAMTVFVAPLTHLVSGAVGSQVLRAALAQEAGAAAPRVTHLWGSALMLAGGLEVGLWLFAGLLPASATELAAALVWVACVALLVRAWMSYVSLWARRIVARQGGPRSPRWTLRLVGWVSAGVLTLLLAPALPTRALLALHARPDLLKLVIGPLLPPADGLAVLTVLDLVLGVVALTAAVGVAGAGFGAAWLGRAGRRRSCCHCGLAFGRGSLLQRVCDGCGERLAPWAVFFKPPDAPSWTVHAPRPSAASLAGTLAAKALILATALGALTAVPLAMTFVFYPATAHFNTTYYERGLMGPLWRFGYPPGAYLLWLVGTVALPCAAVLAGAAWAWRVVRRRERLVHARRIEDDARSGEVLRSWLADRVAPLGEPAPSAGRILDQLSPPYRRLLDAALRGVPLSRAERYGSPWSVALSIALLSATILLLLAALAVLASAFGVSILLLRVAVLGLVYAAGSPPADVWLACVGFAAVCWWWGLVCLAGGVETGRWHLDRQRWLAQQTRALNEQRQALRDHVRACLGQLEERPSPAPDELTKLLQALAA